MFHTSSSWLSLKSVRSSQPQMIFSHIHCNALQLTVTQCNTLQDWITFALFPYIHCNILQHAAIHCNTLEHTAIHYNTLQHTNSASYFLSPPIYTATHSTRFNTLLHAAIRCNTLQHAKKILQRCLTFPLSPHINESCHLYERFMSHTWRIHVTHINDSYHTCEWVM